MHFSASCPAIFAECLVPCLEQKKGRMTFKDEPDCVLFALTKALSMSKSVGKTPPQHIGKRSAACHFRKLAFVKVIDDKEELVTILPSMAAHLDDFVQTEVFNCCALLIWLSRARWKSVKT
jgi:hypothetical protein